jgi:hypothetical protein
MKFIKLTVFILMFSVPCLTFSQQKETLRPKLDLASNISDWDLDGNGAWRIKSGVLQLYSAGTPAGAIRRPAALAILKTAAFKQVTLEVDLRSTAPTDVLRRDVDLIVGYERPARFYYIHLSAATDAVHNGIFLVNDADRRRIDSGQGTPLMKDQEWHRVRVTRDGTTGRIDVFFNQQRMPILSAVDSTIMSGRVGVGSFDDTAEFRNIRVQGMR